MTSLQPTAPSDTDLLSRFTQTRDEDAFSVLVKRHWGFVFSVTRRSLTNSALAEDATQQTFITLSKKAKSLRKDRPLGPWLYRTASHEASNLRRKETRHQKRNKDYEAIAPSFHPEENLLTTKLHKGLADLSAQDRKLIILRFYQGLSSQEIADEFSISSAAAQKRTHRALARLSKLAHSHEDDHKKFSLALPALLGPPLNPSSTSLSQIFSVSGKSSSILLPAAGWFLATTLSIATVKQVVPPPPAQLVVTSEKSTSTRVTSQRKPRPAAKPPKPPRDPGVANFISLARNSPAEALDWSRQEFTSPRYLGEFLEKVTRHLSSHDLDFAKEILAATEGESLRVAIIKEIFEEKFGVDPVSAIRWIESLPHKSDHNAASRVSFSSSFHPAHLVEKLQETLSIATKKSVRLWIVESLCEIYEEIDEPKILDLANSLEGEAQKDALTHLARIQLDRDHPLATELINRLEGEINVDARDVVQRAPARYLDAVLPWIPDPTDHQSTSIYASRFLKTWLNYDPKSARQWFQKNKPGNKLVLTSETRKSLTQSER